MNVKLKALVLAVALAATGTASAEVLSVSGTGSSFTGDAVLGNSSLFLTVYNSATKSSALFDLGSNFSDFNTLPSQSWNLTSATDTANYNSSWTSFLGANAGQLANTFKWAVITYSQNADGTLDNYITTYKGTNTTLTNMSLANNLPSFKETYIERNRDYNPGSLLTSTNGSTYNSPNSPGNATISNAYGTSGKITNQGSLIASDVFDTTLKITSLTYNPNGNGLAATISTPYVGASFNFTSAGVLTYTAAVAAVPETDTYAMLLAGLGVMGFVARRRLAA